jgi:hypothetical protein
MDIRINKKTEELKVGDKVTSDFNGQHLGHVVRTIKDMGQCSSYGSGTWVILEAQMCPTCQCNPVEPETDMIDAGWAIPYKGKTKKSSIFQRRD